jgi:hypothetical protein
MDNRLLAQGLAAGRLAFGVAMIVAPGRIASSWVGPASDRPDFAPIVRGFGARDVVLGAGLLASLNGGTDAVRPWLLGSAAGDAADLVVGLAAAKHLPRNGVLGVGALAGSALALGAYLAAQDW